MTAPQYGTTDDQPAEGECGDVHLCPVCNTNSYQCTDADLCIVELERATPCPNPEHPEGHREKIVLCSECAPHRRDPNRLAARMNDGPHSQPVSPGEALRRARLLRGGTKITPAQARASAGL